MPDLGLDVLLKGRNFVRLLLRIQVGSHIIQDDIRDGTDHDACEKDCENKTVMPQLLSGLCPAHDERAAKKQSALNHKREELNEAWEIGRHKNSDSFNNRQ